MNITRNKIIIACILCVLVGAYFFGGNQADKTPSPSGSAAVEATTSGHAAPKDFSALSGSNEGQSAGNATSETSKAIFAEQTQGKIANSNTSSKSSAGKSSTANSGTGKKQSVVSPASSGTPKPAVSQNTKKANTAHTCTLSVTCRTILDNMDRFNKDKLQALPSNGIIFPAAKVTFYEGESVFNVLQREMKKAGIQMEFATAPIYQTNYIEGIHNLYELDCGDLSGWMYKVNGSFPNYGCSRYTLKNGDVVDWVYTCDLGRDVGGDYLSNGGRGS